MLLLAGLTGAAQAQSRADVRSLSAAAPLPPLPSAQPSEIDRMLASHNWDAAVQRAADSGHILGALIQASRRLQLGRQPGWLSLGHYEPHGAGWRSQIDSRDWFLSARGARNPQAELEATLAAFVAMPPAAPPLPAPAAAQPPGQQALPAASGPTPPPQAAATASDTSETREPAPLVCRYPARFNWILEQLSLQPLGLARPCPAFERFAAAAQPEDLTLVFASAHPGSPSSMFGHTLLRLNRPQQSAAGRLLAPTISFAAQTGDAGALRYIFGGLLGGFDGRYSIAPYHVKLRDYLELENRDLWEYPLQIDAPGRAALTRHLFEMMPLAHDYKFLSENCAFHLLSLIDAARGTTDLTSQFRAWTIPAEMIRHLRKQELLGAPRFYPARRRIVEALEKGLGPAAHAAALNLAGSGLTADTVPPDLDADQQRQVLDLAFEYARLIRVSESGEFEPALGDAERSLLAARAKLGAGAEQTTVTGPAPPESGHAAGRFSVAASSGELGDAVEFSWRPAYHEPLDPPTAYRPNTTLETFRVQMSVDTEDAQLQLDDFRLVNIETIEARHPVFRDRSWRLSAGASRPVGSARMIADLSGGMGLATQLVPGVVAFALADAEVSAGASLESGWRLGLGLHAGLMMSAGPRYSAVLRGRALSGVLGDTRSQWRASLDQAVHLGPQWSIRLGVSRVSQFSIDDERLRLSLLWYG